MPGTEIQNNNKNIESHVIYILTHKKNELF